MPYAVIKDLFSISKFTGSSRAYVYWFRVMYLWPDSQIEGTAETGAKSSVDTLLPTPSFSSPPLPHHPHTHTCHLHTTPHTHTPHHLSRLPPPPPPLAHPINTPTCSCTSVYVFGWLVVDRQICWCSWMGGLEWPFGWTLIWVGTVSLLGLDLGLAGGFILGFFVKGESGGHGSISNWYHAAPIYRATLWRRTSATSTCCHLNGGTIEQYSAWEVLLTSFYVSSISSNSLFVLIDAFMQISVKFYNLGVCWALNQVTNYTDTIKSEPVEPEKYFLQYSIFLRKVALVIKTFLGVFLH